MKANELRRILKKVMDSTRITINGKDIEKLERVFTKEKEMEINIISKEG